MTPAEGAIEIAATQAATNILLLLEAPILAALCFLVVGGCVHKFWEITRRKQQAGATEDAGL
jgi:hypothetical protein